MSTLTPSTQRLSGKTPSGSSDRTQISVLSLLAIAQAILLGVSGSGIGRAAAVLLALAGLPARLRTLWVIAGLIVANLVYHVLVVGVSFTRLGYVGLLVLYGAAATASLAAFFATVSFRTTFAITLVPALGLIAAEAILPYAVPPSVLGVRPRWFDLGRGGASGADVHEPYALLRQTYPSNPRGYFRPLPAERAKGPGLGPGVDYALNALACRGADAAIPNPRVRTRVLLLGGAGAFGSGVHQEDTLASRLEQSLNQKAAGGRGTDVINCGLAGSSTSDQRAFYEQVASKYAADVVVLLMGERDNLSTADERQRAFVHEAGRLEMLSVLVRLWQWGRHEGRRPFVYDGVADDVVKLDEAVRSRGARLAVFVFRTGELDARWGGLVAAVSGALAGRDTPFEDLGLTLLRAHTPPDLAVHPTDPSPNDVAHREAAAAVERLLRTRGLVD